MARLNPDTTFIHALNSEVDGALGKCMQCGACSATCALSPADAPFPRKEMAMAKFGMKTELLANPDIWLCYQCNDCTLNCPRNARPGDVMAAIRKESIIHFAVPSFWATRAARPRFLPVLILLLALLFGLAVGFQTRIADALYIDSSIEKNIVYPHSSFLPHWLLLLFFFSISGFSIVTMAVGAFRFWRTMKQEAEAKGRYRKAQSVGQSILIALKRALTHEPFETCESSPAKWMSHACVVFGFVALCMVTAWVITAPMLTTGFVYPFTFFSPFKLLANLGGAALLIGTILMIRERMCIEEKGMRSTYFDWLFLTTLFLVVLTGFTTEGLHYLRLVPHRHVVYVIHLVAVSILMLNLPFTKFAHFIYRTLAMVFTIHIGRDIVVSAALKEKNNVES